MVSPSTQLKKTRLMHFNTVTIEEVTTKVTEVATLHNTKVEEVDINLPEVVMNHQEVVTLEQAGEETVTKSNSNCNTTSKRGLHLPMRS
jgi:hypothetical protein